ncbi:MAG: hypothetical protein ACRD3M_04060 [Thermoanaerobaculia bacterium]
MERLPEDPRLPAGTGRFGRNALAVGVAALAACVAGAVARPDQFFRSYLLAFLFWNGLTTGAMAVLMLQYLTGGAWGIAIRRELEAATRTLPLTALAFVPLLAGLHRLYEWTHADAVAQDEILRKKALYLNTPFFVTRAVLAFAAWFAVAYFLNKWSAAQDVRPDPAINRRLQRLSGGGLVVYGLTTTFTSVDWVMSLEPHWYSTMYGVLFMIGQALAALALATAAVLSLSRLEPVSGFLGGRHLHDLGKMMFAFTMLWAYVNFSQYLIVWSGNLPEEISWYLARLRGGWGWVGAAVLLFHFALPFLLLLSRQANRNPRTLASAALLLLVMRFVDVSWLVLPAFSAGAFRLGWMDLAAPVGLGGLWLAFYARNLAARPLLPVHDPGFEEAMAHGRD